MTIAARTLGVTDPAQHGGICAGCDGGTLRQVEVFPGVAVMLCQRCEHEITTASLSAAIKESLK